MTTHEKELIAEFNRNVEWLRKNHKSSLNPKPFEETLPEFINVQAAQRILGRGRTWINTRMITPEALIVPQETNTNWFLIYGVDWFREGSRIMFKRDSIVRLKNELRAMGEKYQRQCVNTPNAKRLELSV